MQLFGSERGFYLLFVVLGTLSLLSFVEISSSAKPKTYYDLIGVEQTATLKEIKKAYFELIRKLHPDKNTDVTKQEKEQFDSLLKAYEVLSDVDKRKKYDRLLTLGQTEYVEDEEDRKPNYREDSEGQQEKPKPKVEEKKEDEYDPLTDPRIYFVISLIASIAISIPMIQNKLEEKKKAEEAKKVKEKKQAEEAERKKIEDERLRRQQEREEQQRRERQEKLKKWEEQHAEEEAAHEAEVRRMLEEEDVDKEEAEDQVEAEAEQEVEGEDEEGEGEVKEEQKKEMKKGKKKKKKKAKKVATESTGEEEEEDSDEDGGDDSLYCDACRKRFKSEQQWDNHERSKKHKQNVAAMARQQKGGKKK